MPLRRLNQELPLEVLRRLAISPILPLRGQAHCLRQGVVRFSSKEAIRMLRTLKRLWTDESGLTTVEYALLLVLIVAAGVASWPLLSTQINSVVGEAVSDLTE